MTKPVKLPHKRWKELADVARGYVPEPDGVGGVLCQNVLTEVKQSIESELRRRPHAELERPRQWWITLDRLGDALMYDGPVIGVCFNQPELVTPALHMTRRLKLSKTTRLLRSMLPLRPPASIRNRPKAKEAWFGDPRRAKGLRQIEALYERCEVYREGWWRPSMHLVLENPRAFFDNKDGAGFRWPD